MNRIDVASTPDDFRMIGKLPGQQITIDLNRRYCCVLVAKYLARFMRLDPVEMANTAMGRQLKLQPWYVSGLIWGWDGFEESDLTPGWWTVARRQHPDIGAWRLGQQDGAAAWQACVAAGLVWDSPVETVA